MNRWIAMVPTTLAALAVGGAVAVAGSATASAENQSTDNSAGTAVSRDAPSPTSNSDSDAASSAKPVRERPEPDITSDRESEIDSPESSDAAEVDDRDGSDTAAVADDDHDPATHAASSGTPARKKPINPSESPLGQAETEEPSPSQDTVVEPSQSGDPSGQAESEDPAAVGGTHQADTSAVSTPTDSSVVRAATTPQTSRTSPTMHTAALDAGSASPPARPTLLNYVGSVVLNLVMGLIHLIDGPPALPPNSSVTVRTSELVVPVGTGRSVQADWYFPENHDESTRLVYFQHGIGASGPMYSYTLAKLAEQTHSIIVAPSLSSNFLDPSAEWAGGEPMIEAIADLFVGDRSALTESASAAVGQQLTLPERFLLMGHSLGGYTTVSSGRYLIANGAIDDLVGIVSLDGVDVNGSLSSAIEVLTGENYRPVYHLSSEPYTWNLDGSLALALQAVRPGQFNGVMLEDGRHIDALQGANAIIQFAEYFIAGFSVARNVEAVPIIAAGWVNDLFAGTTDGIYGAADQRTEIPTSKGTAAVVAFPFPPLPPVYGTPFDGISEFILGLIVQVAVYQPLSGFGAASSGPSGIDSDAQCVMVSGPTCEVGTAAPAGAPGILRSL